MNRVVQDLVGIACLTFLFFMLVVTIVFREDPVKLEGVKA